MFRPNVTLKFSAPVIAAVALVAGACGSSHPEQQPLQQFFRASSLGDSQTLANFAAVSFDAKTDGQVTKFNIVGTMATITFGSTRWIRGGASVVS